MEKELKITLVATGFAQASMLGKMEDEEVTKLLRNLKVEEDLDVPSFMRKTNFSERRTMTPTSSSEKAKEKV